MTIVGRCVRIQHQPPRRLHLGKCSFEVFPEELCLPIGDFAAGTFFNRRALLLQRR
jgi:hypothetical protein